MVVKLKNKYDNKVKTVDEKKEIEADLETIVEELGGMRPTFQILASSLKAFLVGNIFHEL